MTTREKCSSCAAYETKVHEQQEEIERLKAFIERSGYRRCDIPACNCNGWHGGHSAQRLVEIGDALTDAGVDLNGRTILEGVRSLATLRARIGELEQEMRNAGEYGPLPAVRRWADQLAALLASSGVHKQEENA